MYKTKKAETIVLEHSGSLPAVKSKAMGKPAVMKKVMKVMKVMKAMKAIKELKSKAMKAMKESKDKAKKVSAKSLADDILGGKDQLEPGDGKEEKVKKKGLKKKPASKCTRTVTDEADEPGENRQGLNRDAQKAICSTLQSRLL